MMLLLVWSALAVAEPVSLDSEATLRACAADEDCVVVQELVCNTTQAVHRGMEGQWKRITLAQRKEIKGKPECEKKHHLPELEKFSARCQSGRCEALSRIEKPE